MITLEGYIIVPATCLNSIKEELPNHIRLTREEEGCHVFQVSQDSDNVNRFNVYEEFSSKSAFELHQRRVKDSRWGQISRDVERHYKVTES